MSNFSISKEIYQSNFWKEYYSYHQKNKILFEYQNVENKYKIYLNIFEKKITDGLFYKNFNEGVKNVLLIGSKIFQYLKKNRPIVETDSSNSVVVSEDSEPVNLFKEIDYDNIPGKNLTDVLSSGLKKIKKNNMCNLNNKVVNYKIREEKDEINRKRKMGYIVDGENKVNNSIPIKGEIRSDSKLEVEEEEFKGSESKKLKTEESIFKTDIENEISPEDIYNNIRDEKEEDCVFENTFKIFCSKNELKLPEIKTENLRKLVKISGVFCDEKFSSKYAQNKKTALSDFYKKLCESYELEVQKAAKKKTEISAGFSYMDLFH